MRGVALYAGLCGLVAALFLAAPGIDLVVSRLFYDGARQFTPAPLPAAQCERNCAFVSGHAAFAFSLVSFAFLLPLGWRRKTAIAAALAFGALVGLGRIAAGGHFLSDVVYAGLIVF